MDNKAEELFNFQLDRDVTSLCKTYLIMLEDMKECHDQMVQKLEKFVDLEVLEAADFFDGEKFTHLRKRILDASGDSKRNIQKNLENFSISFKG